MEEFVDKMMREYAKGLSKYGYNEVDLLNKCYFGFFHGILLQYPSLIKDFNILPELMMQALEMEHDVLKKDVLIR
jgi:hypothetical protein